MRDFEGHSYTHRLQRFVSNVIVHSGIELRSEKGRKAQMSGARAGRLTIGECRSESIDSVKNDKTYK